MIYYSYDELLGFWTHGLDFFDIFRDFNKRIGDRVLRILSIPQPGKGHAIQEPAIGFVKLLKLGTLLFCFDDL